MQREKSQMETVGKSRKREGEKKERIVPVKNKKRGGIDKKWEKIHEKKTILSETERPDGKTTAIYGYLLI